MRRIKLFLILLLSFMLVGCAQQSYFVKVNDDDTVNFKIELKVPIKEVEKFDTLNIQKEEILESKEPLFNILGKKFKDKGFTTSYKEDTTGIIYDVQKIYKNPAEFNAEIKELNNQKLIGLNLNIDKDSKLSGTKVGYHGFLKFNMDDDLKNELKSNSHLIDFMKDVPITATLTIVEDKPIVNVLSMETGEKGEATAIIGGTWDINSEQPEKEVGIVVEEKNQTFALITFGLGGFAILALVFIIIGKKKIDIVGIIKERLERRKDN